MFLHAMRSAMLNVLGLSRAIHRFLVGTDKAIRPPRLLSALTGEEESRVSAEDVSAAQAEEWLRAEEI
jgi:hypothetical protein